MQIKISARHGHLSDATQQFIHEKVQKLPHYFERLTSIEVTVDLRPNHHVVELLVSAEHKHDFVAHETCTDILMGVDAVIAKLGEQLRRYKEKIQDHRRTPPTGQVPTRALRGEETEE